MTVKKKILWLSIVQGLAMLMVVLDHDNLWKVLYGHSDAIGHFVRSFHMALFMFVSGGLFYMTRIKKEWKTKEVYKDKLLRLMLPYAAFTTVCFFLKASFSSYMKRGIGFNMHDFIYSYLCPGEGPLKEMWFLATLFTLMLLYPIYKVLMKKVGGQILLFSVFLIIHVIKLFSDCGPWFNINEFYLFGIWFVSGMIFFKNKWEVYLGKSWCCGLLFILLMSIHVIWDNMLFIVPCLGILWAISFSLLMEKYVPSLFSSFRNYTFQIYLMGLFGQMFIELFIWKRIANIYLFPVFYVLSILVGLYIPVLISKRIEKMGNKYLNMVFGLK